MQKASRLELVPAPFLVSFSTVSEAQATPKAESHELTARAASGVTAQGQNAAIRSGARKSPIPQTRANAASRAKPPRIQAGSGVCPFALAPSRRLWMIQAMANIGGTST